MRYARPNIFEFERNGRTILTANRISGLDFVMDLVRFHTAEGKEVALPGVKKLVEFEVHCRDPQELVNFWNLFKEDEPASMECAIHGKAQNKQILFSLEFENLLPVGGNLYDFNTESTTDEPHGHSQKFIGDLVNITV